MAKGTISSWSCDPSTNGFQFTSDYVLGPNGEERTQLDGQGNWQRTNVHVGAKLIGTYDLVNGQPALHFHLEDPLGTRRMQVRGMSTTLGQPETDFQSLPFGDGFAPSVDPYAAPTAVDASPLHFTGKERDAESGNDYFEARYYSSAMGRFMSPDWSAKEEPVPYAKLDNPQSLNLYSYVYNNPLAKADPDGHCPQCLVWGEQLVEEATESPAGQYVLGAIAAGATAGAGWLAENGGRPGNSAMAPELWMNKDGTSIYSSGSQKSQQSAPAPASGQSTPASPQEPNKDQGGGNSKKP